MRAGKPAGFTLLEVMIVLTILALVWAVVPRTMARGSGTAFRGAVQDLAADLRLLHDQARRNRAVTGLGLAARDGKLGYERLPEKRFQALPAGVTAVFSPAGPLLVDATPEQIVFYPDGSANGGAITLRAAEGLTKTLDVRWLDGAIQFHD